LRKHIAGLGIKELGEDGLRAGLNRGLPGLPLVARTCGEDDAEARFSIGPGEYGEQRFVRQDEDPGREVKRERARLLVDEDRGGPGGATVGRTRGGWSDGSVSQPTSVASVAYLRCADGRG